MEMSVACLRLLCRSSAHVSRTPHLLFELARLPNVLRVLLLVVWDRDALAVLLRRWRRIAIVLQRFLRVQRLKVPVGKFHDHLGRIVDVVRGVVHSPFVYRFVDGSLLLHDLAEVAYLLEIHDLILCLEARTRLSTIV